MQANSLLAGFKLSRRYRGDRACERVLMVVLPIFARGCGDVDVLTCWRVWAVTAQDTDMYEYIALFCTIAGEFHETYGVVPATVVQEEGVCHCGMVESVYHRGSPSQMCCA